MVIIIVVIVTLGWVVTTTIRQHSASHYSQCVWMNHEDNYNQYTANTKAESLYWQ